MYNQSLLSVVVPLYSEAEVIPEFYRRMKNVLTGLVSQYDHEIIFVDDGSRDNSLNLLRDISGEDGKVKSLRLSRNFGHQYAITAGIDYAQGQAVVTIDGDLQDPLEIISDMIEKWRAGNEVVSGVQEKRQGENPIKILTAKVFYRCIKILSNTDLPVDAGDFRLLDRRVVEILKSIREENRYIRGLVRWTGFFLTLISFLTTVWIIFNKIRHPGLVVSGWASLLLAVLFMGGYSLFLSASWAFILAGSILK